MNRYSLVFFTLLLSAKVEAHTGVGPTSGLLTGFMHPLLGWDHVIAMLAVGIWGVQTGGQRMWLLPSVFVVVMAAGALLAMAGFAMPRMETGILLSDLALALFIVCAWRASPLTSVLAVALFAYFHGAAHGSEAPVQVSGFEYTLGFAAATAMLHVEGIAIGMLLKNTRVMRNGLLSVPGI